MSMKKKKSAKKRKSQDSSDEEWHKEQDTIDFKVIKRNGALKHDFEKICTSNAYINPEIIEIIDPKDFTVEYFDRTGLTKPLFFQCKPEELGMVMPDPGNFSEDDVLEMVGGDREVEVVVVEDQSSKTISLSTMIEYYKNPEGRELTNMLSLEFSLTRMRDFVCGPGVVKKVDWVEKYFPDEKQTRSVSFAHNGQFSFNTNFPNVSRYCLMSPGGCYTDFHLDFGGTSVWYHVLKGEKVFFFVEPSDQNFVMYDAWQKNYNLSGWFGDIASKCTRLTLKEGDTAIIPSGWLHAVYTPVKSLVVGGNFLHSYSASMQWNVQKLERKLGIAVRYRYPFFEEINFYVVANIVEECSGRKYVRPTPRTKELEYVGKGFIAEGGHRIPISWEYYKNKMKRLKTVKITEPEGNPSQQMDTLNDPLIFYDQAEDVKEKPNHKDVIGVEPMIVFLPEGMKKITAHLLGQYESILENLWLRKLMKIPDVITRPASMLYCLQSILKERRRQLTELNIDTPIPLNVYEPPTIVTASENNPDEKPDSPLSTRSEELGGFDSYLVYSQSMSKNSDVPEETAKTAAKTFDENNVIGEEVNENGNTGEAEEKNYSDNKEEASSSTNKIMEQRIEIMESVFKQEVKHEMEEDLENENNELKQDVQKDDVAELENNNDTKDNDTTNGPMALPTNENNQNSHDADEDGKKKKERVRKHSPKPIKNTSSTSAVKKSAEKRKLNRSLNDTTSPKAKKKHDPKKDKPEFVGGIPVAPIQTGPVVANVYNFDPMNDIVQLGTGQLRSAYRKSRTNIAPPKQTKIYNLEHKHSVEKEHNDDDEPIPQTEQSNMERAIPRLPGTSFIPELPMNMTPSKQQLPSDLYSPSIPFSENERRLSTSSRERTPDFKLRDRSISFDTPQSSLRNSSFEDSRRFGSTPRETLSSSRIQGTKQSKDEQLHDVSYFLKMAPALVEQLNKLNNR